MTLQETFFSCNCLKKGRVPLLARGWVCLVRCVADEDHGQSDAWPFTEMTLAVVVLLILALGSRVTDRATAPWLYGGRVPRIAVSRALG
jgi:hypothetical protein